VCGVGAVDGEYYPYPPYQTISPSKYHNVTPPCAMLLVCGTKKKRRPHFILGTLPHNAVCCVASIHDSVLWTRGPNSWVLTQVDNRALATHTKTLALAGRTTGRPRSTFLKTLATAVVSRRNTSQMGQNVYHDHPFTVHSLCLFLIKVARRTRGSHHSTVSSPLQNQAHPLQHVCSFHLSCHCPARHD
jgi:hypothetical protein